MKPSLYLVIVSGPPGAGKSTLAKKIAERNGLILLQKDGIKESLFDGMGWSDREWSRKVGIGSYRVLYHLLEAVMSAGQSCLIESNFSTSVDLPKLQALKNRFGFKVIEVVCTCDLAIAFARFKQRVETGDRHPGHQDAENLDGFQIANEGWRDYKGLGLGDVCIKLDMSDFAAIDYDKFYSALDAALAD